MMELTHQVSLNYQRASGKMKDLKEQFYPLLKLMKERLFNF